MKEIIVIARAKDEEEITLAKEVVKLIKEHPQEQINFYNIPQYKIEDIVKDDLVVVTFGTQIAIAVESWVAEKKLQLKLVKLPALRQLKKSEDNKDTRLAALKTLGDLNVWLKLDVFQPKFVVVTEDQLPALNARQILMLEQMTEEHGKISCLQVTKGGRVIEISRGSIPNPKPGAHITFHELYTIRIAMDVLDVTEVTLVINPEDFD